MGLGVASLTILISLNLMQPAQQEGHSRREVLRDTRVQASHPIRRAVAELPCIPCYGGAAPSWRWWLHWVKCNTSLQAGQGESPYTVPRIDWEGCEWRRESLLLPPDS